MRKLFKERKLFKGGNYMRKYGTYFTGFYELYSLMNMQFKFPVKSSNKNDMQVC